MQIFLFDIDGTLIRSGGAGKAAMETALSSAFGIQEIRDRVSYAGRTDLAIVRDLLLLHDIEASPENIERLKDAYLAHLPWASQSFQGMVLPGVVELITELKKQPNVAMGLLTGNILAGAEIKLRHYGLWDHFAFGGFADGIPERDDVARHAFRVTEKYLQRTVAPDSIWVIGDTPADVRCGKAIGAKTLAVGTGWHTPEELYAAKPDHYLPNFADLSAFPREWGLSAQPV